MPPARTCITEAVADEINGDDAAVRNGLAQSNAAPGCEVKNIVIAGSRVDFDTICDGQAVATSLTYAGDTYSGEMTMAGTQTMTLTARHVDACPAGDAP